MYCTYHKEDAQNWTRVPLVPWLYLQFIIWLPHLLCADLIAHTWLLWDLSLLFMKNCIIGAESTSGWSYLRILSSGHFFSLPPCTDILWWDEKEKASSFPTLENPCYIFLQSRKNYLLPTPSPHTRPLLALSPTCRQLLGSKGQIDSAPHLPVWPH